MGYGGRAFGHGKNLGFIVVVMCGGEEGLGLEDGTEVESEVGMRLGLKGGTELGCLNSSEL
eukprot:13878948-Ditylum_brightwellii.AAC.1